MTKRNIFLLVLTLLLVALFFYVNKGWFASEEIRISHRSGPPLRFQSRMRQNNKAVIPLFFDFNRKLKLNSVKVIPLAGFETNQHPFPMWNVVAAGAPVATKGFEYGGNIPGMKPAVPGAEPYPLEPGAPYRLLIESGAIKASHDFTPEAPAH